MTLIKFRKFLKFYTMEIWNFQMSNFEIQFYKLTIILYLNDFDKILKIFEILYYGNMEFSNVKF